jgi:hypothetical protein
VADAQTLARIAYEEAPDRPEVKDTLARVRIAR